MTDDYLRRRDGGELPRAAQELLPRFRALAARECCDYQPGGTCLRTSRDCLLRTNAAHRCTWLEEAVLPLDVELQADASGKLFAEPTPAKLNSRERRWLRAVCDAVDAVLDRQAWVSAEDIARVTGLSRKAIERVLPAAIAELGLRKHRRGREQWRLP